MSETLLLADAGVGTTLPRAVAPILSKCGAVDVLWEAALQNRHVRLSSAEALKTLGWLPTGTQAMQALSQPATQRHAVQVLNALGWQPASDAELVQFRAACPEQIDPEAASHVSLEGLQGVTKLPEELGHTVTELEVESINYDDTHEVRERLRETYTIDCDHRPLIRLAQLEIARRAQPAGAANAAAIHK